MSDLQTIDTARPRHDDATLAFAAFDQLWAVAVLMHIAGNPISKTGLEEVLLRGVTVVLGATALWLLLRPGIVAVRRLLAVATIASLVLEAPVTGNHWLMAALVSIAILVASFRPDPWKWFSTTARPMLLAFYFFAAFAKLNSGFFDPVESCARFYANQTLDGFGLPGIGGTVLPIAVAIMVATTELSVPFLLFFRATRRWGVMVGVIFHFLVSFDLNQHFYDFSSMLFALFALFLGDASLRRFGSFTFGTRAEATIVGGGAIMVALMAASPPSNATNGLRVLTFIPWLVFAIAIVRRLATTRPRATEARLGAPSLVGTALLALVLLNGLTPYLEIKTATSWNMYANLVTHDGESNHLIVQHTFPLFDRDDELVVVTSSTDEALQRYADSEYAVPIQNLRNYLDNNPDSTVVVIAAGEVVTLTGADGEATNVLLDKFASFRSVDIVGEPGCQASFLVAR